MCMIRLGTPPDPHQLRHFSASTLPNHFKFYTDSVYSSRPIYWYIFRRERRWTAWGIPKYRFFDNWFHLFRTNEASYRPNLFGSTMYLLSHPRQNCLPGMNRRKVSRGTEMRISGQGLARLDDFGHNNTKQSPFPTTWRERLKEHNDWVSSIGLVPL
jgi:hypothetical protein